MDKVASIVQQLQQERARIDAALQALTVAVSNNRGTSGTARTGARTLSAAQFWAQAKYDRWSQHF